MKDTKSPFLSVGELCNEAFTHWKERIIPYLGTLIFFGFLWILITILIIIFGGMVIIIGLIFTKSFFTILLVAGIAILLTILSSIYLFALFILTSVNILVGKKQSILSMIQSMKPLVFGYIWVALSSAIFLTGLFPYGIITLFILPMIWTFWSSFTTFVYLEKKEHGLQNLWTSRDLYNQKFWELLFRSLLPLGGSILIMIFYVLIAHFIPLQALSAIILYFVFHLLNILYGSFVICYNYELYRLLPKTKKAQTPKVWIILSLIGWIINIVLILSFSYFLLQIIPNFQHYYDYVTHIDSSKSSTFHQDTNTLYYTSIIGHPAILTDRTVMVETVQKNYQAAKADNLSLLEQFILVNVSITNTSQHILQYSPYDFFLVNKTGDLTGPTFSFSLSDSAMLGSGQLAPGAKKTGAIIFKVISHSEPFTLIYQPIINSPVRKFAVEINLK